METFPIIDTSQEPVHIICCRECSECEMWEDVYDISWFYKLADGTSLCFHGECRIAQGEKVERVWFGRERGDEKELLPLLEKLHGPFKAAEWMSTRGVGGGWGGQRDEEGRFCLKTASSNQLQDADTSKKKKKVLLGRGQVGSRLPLTRSKVKTAGAEPAGSGRKGRREGKQSGQR